MSNYLSRLVNRSLNPFGVIQPRLASRFEPGSNLRQVANPFQENVEQAVTVQDSGTTLAPLNPSSVNRVPTASPQEIAETSQSTSNYSTSNYSMPDIHSSPTEVISTPEIAQPHHPVRPNPVRPNLTELKQTPSALPEQFHPTSSLPPSMPMVQSSKPALVREPILTIDQTVMPPRSLQPNSNLFQPMTVPLSSGEKESVVSSPQSTLPTVQVKIGRIDVRAIPSTQPTRQVNRSTTSPKLSLADYLKTRQGNR